MESNPEGEGYNDGETKQGQGVCCGGQAPKRGVAFQIDPAGWHEGHYKASYLNPRI